ncbi:hypothetical protein GJ496_005535 [Pomphorhynchus laevis]|nr:hypothetical protein GJ496_005535 [Pomphorhynchus laevis]
MFKHILDDLSKTKEDYNEFRKIGNFAAFACFPKDFITLNTDNFLENFILQAEHKLFNKDSTSWKRHAIFSMQRILVKIMDPPCFELSEMTSSLVLTFFSTMMKDLTLSSRGHQYRLVREPAIKVGAQVLLDFAKHDWCNIESVQILVDCVLLNCVGIMSSTITIAQEAFIKIISDFDTVGKYIKDFDNIYKIFTSIHPFDTALSDFIALPAFRNKFLWTYLSAPTIPYGYNRSGNPTKIICTFLDRHGTDENIQILLQTLVKLFERKVARKELILYVLYNFESLLSKEIFRDYINKVDGVLRYIKPIQDSILKTLKQNRSSDYLLLILSVNCHFLQFDNVETLKIFGSLIQINEHYELTSEMLTRLYEILMVNEDRFDPKIIPDLLNQLQSIIDSDEKLNLPDFFHKLENALLNSPNIPNKIEYGIEKNCYD